MEEVRQQMGDGPVYLTFDIDALDPAFAPGTGRRVLCLLHALSKTLRCVPTGLAKVKFFSDVCRFSLFFAFP